MDEEEWEELDENAMEECMVLATQLCSQQPQDQGSAVGGQNNTHTHTAPHSTHHDTHSRKAPGVVSNGYPNSVRDSGVSSTRGSSSFHRPSSSISNSNLNQRKDASSSSYMSRFSDFSSSKSHSSHHNTLTRKLSHSSSLKGLGVVVSGGTSPSSSPSKTRSPVKPWPGSDGTGSYVSLKKAEEEKAKLDERILVMQGEISLLRSELKRKETALETERLDHCAAIEATEKRGREKVAKQAAEAESKLKEKSIMVDKLQSELHFKKREIEELLQRCHRLEQQPQALQTTQSSGPASKRPRPDKSFVSSAKDTNTSISSRFDFSRRPAKVCVEVQTESAQPKPGLRRRRLNVASPRGQVCQTRSIATLLSCSSVAASQHTSPSTPNPVPPALSCGSAGWSLPSDWLNIISQGLREKDKNVEQKLVDVAVERLQQTSVAVERLQQTSVAVERLQQTGGDHSRLPHHPSDPTEWYEGQVGPAVQILSYFKSSSDLSTLQAVIAHLSPLCIKDVVVNRRICYKLLEATEWISRTRKLPIERTSGEPLVSALRKCCGSIEDGSEAGTLLRVAAALSPHCQLCVSSDVCLIGQLCKKVKKFCAPEVDTLRALLDLTWAVVKTNPSSLWLSSSCPCSSQLLGTFVWHIYQTLQASQHAGKQRQMYQVLASCVQVLHHWSTVDTDWWEKVSHFPQYPALMATIANKATDINFDRETVELLCDLYEFEDGAFER